ncbi:hypothetical protein [Lactiplantibacillus plantarum]|nr:hypothetical protein [Lactiplantibacillus plantarum]
MGTAKEAKNNFRYANLQIGEITGDSQLWDQKGRHGRYCCI